MGYKYVIFDMDGTILDTKAALEVACKRGMEQFQLREPFDWHEFQEAWGGNILGLLIRFVEEHAILPITREEIRAKLAAQYNEDLWNRYISPFPGVSELLSNLKRKGIQLWVFSNSPQDTVESLMEYFFPGLFDEIIGLSEYAAKPNPAALQAVFCKRGIDRREILMVGDTPVDYIAACNAEIDFVGVVWKEDSELEQLIRETGIVYKKTAKELEAYILS